MLNELTRARRIRDGTLAARFWKHVLTIPNLVAFEFDAPPFSVCSSAPAQCPDGRCQKGEGKRIKLTWRDAGYAVAGLMIEMEKLGIGKGDRVAVLSWSRVEWILHCLAAWTLGAVTVGIDPRYGAERVAYIINDSNHSNDPGTATKLLLCEDQEQLAKVDMALIANQEMRVLPIELLPLRVSHFLGTPYAGAAGEDRNCDFLAAADAELEPEIIAIRLGSTGTDDIALLLYTSGSTGDPKGVMISHGNIAAMCRLLTDRFPLAPTDRFLGPLPLSHILCWNGLGPMIWQGLPSLLCSPFEMERYINSFHPTVLLGVPKAWSKIKEKVESRLDRFTLIKRLSRTPRLSWLHAGANWLVRLVVNHRLGGALRLRVTGGAPLPSDVYEFYMLYGQKLLRGYGATETTGCISVETDDRTADGSAGFLFSEATASFEERPGHQSDAAVGTTSSGARDSGVLWLKGPTIAKGYWNQPEKTGQAFRDGAFRTGDMARLVNEFLFIGDREDDVGKLENGEKVSASEVAAQFAGSDLIVHVVPVFRGDRRVNLIVFLAPSRLEAYADREARLAVVQAVAAEVRRANDRFASNGEHWKRISAFHIAAVTPTTENGLLNIKGEISARAAAKMFAGVIEAFRSADRASESPVYGRHMP